MKLQIASAIEKLFLSPEKEVAYTFISTWQEERQEETQTW